LKYDKHGRKIGPNDWQCPARQCGENNYSRRQECYKCKTAKPGQQEEKEDFSTQQDFGMVDGCPDNFVEMDA